MNTIIQSLIDNLTKNKNTYFCEKFISWFLLFLTLFRNLLLPILKTYGFYTCPIIQWISEKENCIYIIITISSIFNMYSLLFSLLNVLIKIKENFPAICFEIYTLDFYFYLWIYCCKKFNILNESFSILHFFLKYFPESITFLLYVFFWLPSILYLTNLINIARNSIQDTFKVK